eukprot:CAMPEP_0116135244 /NCGR_PEP_ID=MMETSP0329-20121206/11088_1 /TAXON_ID=697910 /ORGANISM="Pseudo-nitzschia arenysensis, Strain B593" /LENGTH=170 /DNA_ID=CAMNT_0003630033 /DNA_START=171 /DNA_END=683 /DNA_ORIENTATION=-
MMKEQQKECSEIHTIQIFREALSCKPGLISHNHVRQSPEIVTTSTTGFGPQNEISDGIGGDWAIETDEDAMEIEHPSTVLDKSQRSQEGESSLYSFYFETPIVSMGQDSASDDYTITSHDTDSFHNENYLNVDHIDDIWEQGLARSSSFKENMTTPQSDTSMMSTQNLRK